MRSSWRGLALVAAVALPLGAALAAAIPQRPSGRVTDLVGVLSFEQRRALEERLAAFERETTHQVAVLIIASLGGEDIVEFSHKVATTWKLGRAGVDNGVLLLIAVRDRKGWIQVGYGLEPSLPDGLVGAIYREATVPRFRQGDFAGGISAGLDRIFAATRKADLASVPARRAADARRAWGSRLALYLLVGLGLFGLAHFVAHQFMGRGYWTLFGLSGAGLAAGAMSLNAVPWSLLVGWAALGVGLAVVQHFVEEVFRCPRCGGWLGREASPVQGAARESQEAVVSSCPRCQFRSRVVRRAALAGAAAGAGTGFWFGSGGGGWSGGGGGDSGFSGGGGDFGGGGAGGDW